MKSFFLFLTTTITFFAAIGQTVVPTPQLKVLEDGFFKWNQFSFTQNWHTLVTACQLDKLSMYPEYYFDHFCGPITDTGKSYLLENAAYHTFNHFQFDRVLLHITGSRHSSFSIGSLFFIKKLENPNLARKYYTEMLQSFKKAYGNVLTRHLTKYRQSQIDSLQPGTDLMFLNDSYPFESAELTEWKGYRHIYFQIDYIDEASLIVLSVYEYPENAIKRTTTGGLYAASEYEEKFSNAFKEFDNRNGYKKLKFGMSRSAVANLVPLKPTQDTHDFKVESMGYRNWFDIQFDFCDLTFNKKNQLYDVQLFKADFSDQAYFKMIKDLYELLGNASKYRESSNDAEFTSWKGRKINLILMRGKESSISVDITAAILDDSSPADKLY